MKSPIPLSLRAHHVLGYTGPFAVSMTLGLTLWVFGLDGVTGPPTAPIPVRLGVLVVVAVASAFRRRAPAVALALAAVATGVDAVVGPSLAVWLIASDALNAAALYGGKRLSRAVVVAGVVGSVLTVCVVAYQGADARTVTFTVLLLAAFVGTPLWWGRSVRSYRRMAELERDRAQAMRAVAERDRAAAVTADGIGWHATCTTRSPLTCPRLRCNRMRPPACSTARAPPIHACGRPSTRSGAGLPQRWRRCAA